MSKNIIHSDNAPAAIGAYSQAVRAAVGVAALPRDALVEAEAVMVLAD